MTDRMNREPRMKSYMAKTGEIVAKWHLVDVSGKILGRAATRIAGVLMGKHRPEYTPHVDTGDFVIVINAEKIKVSSAKKLSSKVYQSYSGYPGGHKTVPMREVLKKHPDRVVREAVRRMLPKTRLGKHMLTKLKVYAGSDHPHQAQQPTTLEL
jgi:large subunit ribosomal protein L13